MQYLELILRYICSAAENITPEELLLIVQQTLDKQGGEVAMTIAEQLRKEGRQEGRQEGKFIGEILLTQRMLALTIYDEEELERKSLDELRSILASMEAKPSGITKDNNGDTLGD